MLKARRRSASSKGTRMDIPLCEAVYCHWPVDEQYGSQLALARARGFDKGSTRLRSTLFGSNDCDPCLFHGGNTGSNPVGDAKIPKNLQFSCSLYIGTKKAQIA